MPLAGCITPGVGSGPLTLSQGATQVFQQYKARFGPLNFVVSEDGRIATYDYCIAGLSACVVSSKYNLIERCEQASRKKCYVLAHEGRIVWDGPVTLFGATAPVNASAKPSRYKEPSIGMRLETEGGGTLQVAKVEGPTVVTADAQGKLSHWFGGILLVDAESDIAPKDLAPLWQAEAGSNHRFSEWKAREGWRNTITFVGGEALTIDGRSLETLRFTRERRSIMSEQGDQHYRETLWYAPEVGFLVRRDVEHVAGPRAESASFKATKVVLP
ncbi:MAG: hypothetical protein JNK11_04800 [Alphaproteobacteria bacterium]|nr:hypothetical protein [Alphaproteobacteria bacterium]